MRYQSEQELCQPVIDHLRSLGWNVYPEFHIWDILCAYKTKKKTWLLGIQAKLKWDITLLRQCVQSKKFAHWTLALVGNPGRHKTREEYQRVCNELGVLFYYGVWNRSYYCPTFKGTYNIWSIQYLIETTKQCIGISSEKNSRYHSYWRRNLKNPYNRDPKIIELPHFEPDLPAGVPSPGGYPTPFTLGVRKVAEYMLSSNKPITIKEAQAISDIAYSSMRMILREIGDVVGKKNRSLLFQLKPDGIQIAKNKYQSGWLDELDVKQ